jgi:hypothetical protein
MKTRIEPLCARQDIAYTCTRQHHFEVTFAAGITIPAEWECRCGAGAVLADAGHDANAEAAASEHARNMGQLRGRRTEAELEELLTGRLAQVRAGASHDHL